MTKRNKLSDPPVFLAQSPSFKLATQEKRTAEME
jgi:hypothetical protein